jgi:hypothetical protein
MTTAIIGTGNIGGTLARHLVRGGEPVVLAAKDEANAAALAQELGELARAASVEEAIAEADAVVFAVWLDTTKELIAKHASLLEDKVVVDPSNPLGFDENGQMIRALPDDQSSGSVVAALLPQGFDGDKFQACLAFVQPADCGVYFLGDYIAVASTDSKAQALWTGNGQHAQDVFSARATFPGG